MASTKGPISTTGVTGMLVQGEFAHNVTVVTVNTPTGVEYAVRDNLDGTKVAYEPVFAVWITQRNFVRVMKKLTGKALEEFNLNRVKLDPLMVADLKKAGFKLYDHKTFIEKMDLPRSKAILVGLDAAASKRAAA